LLASLNQRAQADLTAEVGDIRTYNLVVATNLNNTSNGALSVDGTALVGGNVGTSSASLNMNFGSALNSAYFSGSTSTTSASLTVGGNIYNTNTMEYGNVRFNSGATVAAQSFTNGGNYQPDLNTPSSTLSMQIQTALTSAANNLEAMAGSGQTINNPSTRGAVTLDASSANGGVAVFNLSGSLLNNSNVTSLNLANSGSASAIVINVSGTSVVDTTTLGGDFAANSTTNAKIIWNFYQATSLSGTQAIDGAVLGATADLNNYTGSLNGAVFVNQFEPASSIHLPYTPVTGGPKLNYTGPGFSSSPTPEPATIISTLSGLAIVGLVTFQRHRRRLSA
jgi:choice-of-anchor A domain-containing protein